MKKIKAMLVFGAIFSAASLMVSAQTNEVPGSNVVAAASVVVETNVVTVLVTNVVTVTNIVVAAPAPAPAPAAADLEKKYPWESSLTAGLTLTRGNSQSLSYSAGIKTAKKTPENEYMFGLGGTYGSQNSKDSANNYKANGQWNHFFSDNFFGYVLGDATRDLIAGVDYRFNIGPGAGYYLIKDKETTLATEAGFGYQYEHLFGVGGYKSFATVRLAERFDHKFGDRAKIWQKAELLPQVDKVENFVLNLELGVEVYVSKSFGLNTTLIDTYQNRPATGRQKNDVTLISGITYKF